MSNCSQNCWIDCDLWEEWITMTSSAPTNPAAGNQWSGGGNCWHTFLIDVSRVNAWLCYKHNTSESGRQPSHRLFTVNVANSLIAGFAEGTPASQPLPQPVPRQNGPKRQLVWMPSTCGRMCVHCHRLGIKMPGQKNKITRAQFHGAAYHRIMCLQRPVKHVYFCGPWPEFHISAEFHGKQCHEIGPWYRCMPCKGHCFIAFHSAEGVDQNKKKLKEPPPKKKKKKKNVSYHDEYWITPKKPAKKKKSNQSYHYEQRENCSLLNNFFIQF